MKHSAGRRVSLGLVARLASPALGRFGREYSRDVRHPERAPPR